MEFCVLLIVITSFILRLTQLAWILVGYHILYTTLRLGRQYIYTNNGVIRKETNDWNENDDEFSSSSSWRTFPLQRFDSFAIPPPKKISGLYFYEYDTRAF